MEILIVDDEESILEIIGRCLEAEGYGVRCAATPAEALGILAEEPCRLLITDYRMPGMNGTELIEKARASHPGLKSIVMSVYYDQTTEIQNEISRVADALVKKPFSLKDVTAAVAALLGEGV